MTPKWIIFEHYWSLAVTDYRGSMKNIPRNVIDQFRYLTADLRRWPCYSFRDYFYAIFEFGLWVTVLYRISRALFVIDIPLLKYPLRIVAFFVSKFSELFFGVLLRPGTDIGPGLYIGHTGVIMLHADVKAGANLSIGHAVTIGTRGLGSKGTPVLGDNVYIGVGAKIIGNITVGNNVRIGANSVVLQNLPDGVTAVGVPARIVNNDNSS